MLREATAERLDQESHQHEWACWQRKYSERSMAFSGFTAGGSSACPSLLGHDDLIFFWLFIVGCENSLSPPKNQLNQTRSTESSVSHLLPFRLPRELEGQTGEAPPAAPLCGSLDRTASEANTFEESERETGRGEPFSPHQQAVRHRLLPSQTELEQ